MRDIFTPGIKGERNSWFWVSWSSGCKRGNVRVVRQGKAGTAGREGREENGRGIKLAWNRGIGTSHPLPDIKVA